MNADVARAALPPGDPREILRHLYADAKNGTLSGRLARADLREIYHRALRDGAANDG